jgi:hypothetical protein
MKTCSWWQQGENSVQGRGTALRLSSISSVGRANSSLRLFTRSGGSTTEGQQVSVLRAFTIAARELIPDAGMLHQPSVVELPWPPSFPPPSVPRQQQCRPYINSRCRGKEGRGLEPDTMLSVIGELCWHCLT